MNHFFQTRLALFLALPVGASLALAFAPFGWWPLAVLCPVYLFLAWHYVAPRRAAKIGFLFTAGLFLAGTYWLYHTIHEVGHAPAWIALFLMFGMVAIIGGYTAAVGYAIARWLRPSDPPLRSPEDALASPAPATFADPGAAEGRDGKTLLFTLLVVPAAWTLLEWFRGWFLSGFPWFALGYSQTDSPLVGFAPVGGVYTISLLVAISSGALICLINGTKRTRIIAASTLVVIWASGALLKQHEWTQPVGRPLTAAIVQGAVPQDLKWSQGYLNSTLELYQRLTQPHLGKDIILWPEAALPALPEQIQDYLGTMWRNARSNRSTLITGLLHYGDQGNDDIRNGLLVLDAEAQWYDKRRLVPFGEFFPVPGFVREWMKLKDLPHSDITAGAHDQPALNVAGQKIGATICYEDAYGAEQLDVLKEATLLVNVTNDAWFGDTTAAPQHLQISRMRVIEAGRPLLRAANDGISAIISADGTVERTLPRFQPGVLVGVVQPRVGLPPYAQTGNVPLVVLCLMLLAVGFWTVRKASSTV